MWAFFRTFVAYLLSPKVPLCHQRKRRRKSGLTSSVKRTTRATSTTRQGRSRN
jgi:hypothetical protein